MPGRRHSGISRRVRPDRFSAGEAGEPLRASCCLTPGMNLSLNQPHRIQFRESGWLPAGAISCAGTRWTGRGADGAPRIISPRDRAAPGPAGQGDPDAAGCAARKNRSGPRRLLRSHRPGRTAPRRGAPQADRLVTDADLAAETPRQAASAAVHRLRALVGTATEVASLCGISAGEVRAVSPGPFLVRSQPRRPLSPPAPIWNPMASPETAGPGAPPAIPPRDAPGHRPGQGADTAGMTSVGEERESASWLAARYAGSVAAPGRHRVYADRGGQEDGYLAARRLLDERLRQMVHWPTGQEYARLAGTWTPTAGGPMRRCCGGSPPPTLS